MRLILRRVALYVVTAIVAITINFFLPRLLPGNPALAVLGKAQSAESPQAVAALEVQYGAQTRTGEMGAVRAVLGPPAASTGSAPSPRCPSSA
jgi:peptide/nickel transport system permease protein